VSHRPTPPVSCSGAASRYPCSAPAKRARRLWLGAAGSFAVHVGAAAALTTALAWRAAPPLPPVAAAVELVWLDASPPATPVAVLRDVPPLPPDAPIPSALPAAPIGIDGFEPEDSLLTMDFPSPPAVLAAPAPEPAPEPAPPPPVAAASPRPNLVIAALPVPTPPPARPAPRAVDPAPAQAQARERSRAAESVAATLRPPAPPARVAPAPAPTPLHRAPPATSPPTAEPSAFVQPARFRRAPPPPPYPMAARDRGEEGTVVLRLLIDPAGGTRDIRLHRSSGNRLLDEAALQHARSWEIIPTSIDGRPVDDWVEAPVRFRLER